MVNTNEFLNKIKEYDSIVIFGHMTCDGDCYSSEIALREIIRINFPNKKVYAVGSGLPKFFDILAPLDNPSDEIISNSLGILVDVNHQDRSEDQRIKISKEIIKIDHHIEEKPFNGVKVLDTSAIACAQIIAELVVAHNLKLNDLAASCLYLGIVTDSGRFMFSPTDGKTFELVAYLFNYNIDYQKLFEILYENDPRIMKYKGYMLLNFITTGRLIYFVADKDLYKKFDLNFDDVSGLVNTFMNIKDNEIYLLFTEKDDGMIRVEYRSKHINVQPIAVKYGGGGHKHAAGCRIYNKADIENIINDCLKLLEEEY